MRHFITRRIPTTKSLSSNAAFLYAVLYPGRPQEGVSLPILIMHLPAFMYTLCSALPFLLWSTPELGGACTGVNRADSGAVELELTSVARSVLIQRACAAPPRWSV